MPPYSGSRCEVACVTGYKPEKQTFRELKTETENMISVASYVKVNNLLIAKNTLNCIIILMRCFR